MTSDVSEQSEQETLGWVSPEGTMFAVTEQEELDELVESILDYHNIDKSNYSNPFNPSYDLLRLGYVRIMTDMLWWENTLTPMQINRLEILGKIPRYTSAYREFRRAIKYPDSTDYVTDKYDMWNLVNRE